MPPNDPTGTPKPGQTPQARSPSPPPPQVPIPPVETLRLAQFMRAAAHHSPEVRTALADIAQRVDPNGVGKAFSDVSFERRFTAWEKKQEEKELQAQINAATAAQVKERDQLKKERGFTDDQIKDIEATMRAKGVSSYRDGAILYEADHPAAPVEAPEAGSATWEFPSVTTRDGKALVDFKKFQKDPKSAAYNAAYRVIDEFKFNKLPPAFHRVA